MDQITIKKNQPLQIPIVFKKTVILNTTIDRDKLEELINSQFNETITLVQPSATLE